MHHDELGALLGGRLDATVEALARDFRGNFSRGAVERFVHESCDRLSDRPVTGPNFLPLLVGRFARERLSALAQAEGHVEKTRPEVLFVCVHNAGRSQIAAALTDDHLSDGSVAVRSAGSHPGQHMITTHQHLSIERP